MAERVIDRRLAIGERIGDYEVLAHLGEGAAADVYLVRHPRRERVCAAKVLKPSVVNLDYIRTKFAQETRILSELRHSHIIRVLDAVQEGDVHACIMEHVDGSTLEEYLPLHPGGLSEVIALSIGIQVIDAMSYAHSMDIVHRDLKPANILLQQDSDGGLYAFVVDFGLAKAVGKQRKTRTGLQIGTMAYMAPEQIRDSSRVDERADIYALGITLFECLTGGLPFPYRSMFEMLEAQMSQPIPSVRHQRSDISEHWDTFVERACAKDREERFQTANEMLQSLQILARELQLRERTTHAMAPIRKVEDLPRTDVRSVIQTRQRLDRLTQEAPGLMVTFDEASGRTVAAPASVASEPSEADERVDDPNIVGIAATMDLPRGVGLNVIGPAAWPQSDAGGFAPTQPMAAIGEGAVPVEKAALDRDPSNDDAEDFDADMGGDTLRSGPVTFDDTPSTPPSDPEDGARQTFSTSPPGGQPAWPGAVRDSIPDSDVPLPSERPSPGRSNKDLVVLLILALLALAVIGLALYFSGT